MIQSINPDAPAFAGSNPFTELGDGLTVRAWMATMILAGMAANPKSKGGSEQFAEVAIQTANALITGLNKGPEKEPEPQCTCDESKGPPNVCLLHSLPLNGTEGSDHG